MGEENKMLKIFTLNWNGKDKLEYLKKSLIPELEGIEYQWYIKDNGSTDNSVDLIKYWNNKDIIPMAYKDNKQNYSQGMNYLYKHSEVNDKDYILTLNNDIIFKDHEHQSIKNMLKIIQEDISVGQVGAKLNFKDSDRIQHCGVVFNGFNALPMHLKSNIKETAVERKDRLFPAVTGAVSLMRASDWKSIDGFDEKYMWAFEDIDQSFKILYNLNKKIVYCGNTKIEHFESSTLKINPVNRLFLNQNSGLFISKWRNYIDKTLVKKYTENDNYNLYIK